MNLVVQIALGVILGLSGTLLVLWLVAVITQYLSGDRYFTPSRHIIAERLRKKKSEMKKKEETLKSSPIKATN